MGHGNYFVGQTAILPRHTLLACNVTEFDLFSTLNGHDGITLYENQSVNTLGSTCAVLVEDASPVDKGAEENEAPISFDK